MTFDGRLLGGISVLAAVVETGNFVRAAEALGLTPSGVSRAVARLEARVGVRLLDRTPRAVTLTDEGRRFHARVVPLLAGLEETAADAAGAAATARGRLRVNVDPWVARLVLAPRLSAFLAAPPALSLDPVRQGGVDSSAFEAAIGQAAWGGICAGLGSVAGVTSSAMRAGSVCLNRLSGLIGGASAGFRPPRSAAAG